MKLPLAYYGNPILRKKTAPLSDITDDIRQLVLDMAETMNEHNGCGLAAPQIHRSIALFITSFPRYDAEENLLPGEIRVFINPKILAHSQELDTHKEGCLSIPKLREEVLRPIKITVQATNLEGEEFVEDFEDFDARVVMHENDHLNGVLFIDRLPLRKKKEIESFLREIKKKHTDPKKN